MSVLLIWDFSFSAVKKVVVRKGSGAEVAERKDRSLRRKDRPTVEGTVKAVRIDPRLNAVRVSRWVYFFSL
jgi:hypothetical protein